MTGRFFLWAVKTLIRVTLSNSFRIRPPNIYRAPGIAQPPAQMGGIFRILRIDEIKNKNKSDDDC